MLLLIQILLKVFDPNPGGHAYLILCITHHRIAILTEEMTSIFANDSGVSEEHKQTLEDLKQFLFMKTRNISFVVVS